VPLLSDQNSRHMGLKVRKISLVLTALGGFSQFGQILTFREIMAQCHGSELLFGLVLGSWLLWCAAGTALGAWWTKNWGNFEPSKTLALSILAAGPLLAGQILWLRLAPWGVAVVPGQLLSPGQSALLALLSTGPLAFLAGYQFSLALKASPPGAVGPLFRAEAWGAMVGGLLTALVLVHLSGALTLALIGGVLLTFLAFGLLHPQIPRSLAVSAAALSLVLLTGAVLPLDRWSEEYSWSRRLPGRSLVQVHNTRYGRLAWLQDRVSGQHSVFQNGEFLGAVGEGDKSIARQLAAVTCGQHPEPAKALLIGGLLSNLPFAMLEHGLKSLEVVELDPAVGQLASQLGLVTVHDPRLRLISADGRALIKQSSAGGWDLVVVLLPEPDNSLANRYCTVEFFQEVKRGLKPGGVLCLLLPAYGASPSYTSPTLARRTGAILAALDRVFRETRAAPLGGHLLVASDRPGQSSFDPGVLANRLLRRPQAWPDRDNQDKEPFGQLDRKAQCRLYFETLLGGVLAWQSSWGDDTPHQPLVEHFQRDLRSYPAKANRDGQPVEISYSFVLSGMVAQGDGETTVGPLSWYVWLMEWLSSPMGILPLAALFLVTLSLGAVSLRVNTTGHPVTLSFLLALLSFTTGIFAMTILIALLFVYQNLCGYIYVDVGLLSAMFMAGLALGALAADRWNGVTPGKLSVLLGTMVILSLLPPLGLGEFFPDWGIRSLVGVLLLAAGFADGAMFLMLTRQSFCWFPGGLGPWVYSADLAGSGLASFLTGAVLIPALGTAWTLRLVAALLIVVAPALLAWSNPD
jgi:spermidine synthase